MSSVSALNSLLSSSSTSDSSSLDLSSLLTAATGATSTGIDVTSAVDAAIYAAQAPERQWQAEQSTLQSQVSALGGLQTALGTLSDDLNALGDSDGALAARTVTSSNSGLVTASATPQAAAGTHTVSVSNLATAASWYSPVLAGGAASLGSSSLSITSANGSQTTFTFGGSQTMASLASSINAANLGVTASVVQDASGSRLALVGQSTGSAAAFQVSIGSASATSWTSADLAGTSSTVPASSFQVSDGTTSATINVASGASMEEIANQINAAGLDVSAQVATDSAGAHLEIDATSGGNVTVSSDPTLAFTQASQAANASFSVDGIPLTSASNTVKGALTGVTLDLTGASSTAQATLQVAPDMNAAVAAISQFVTDYNTVLSSVSGQFTYSATSSSQGVLGSDATVRSLQSTLLGITGIVSSNGQSSTTLASLGISVNDDGSLSVDTSALTQALSNNSSAVQNFLQGTASNGFVASVQQQLNTFTDPANGSLATDVQSLTQQYNDLQSQVNDFESGYIANQKTLLTNMYSQAEIALQSLPTTLKQIQAELSNNSGS